MTVALSADLQRAVYARLSTALSAAGVGGDAVPVYDHVPQDPPRLHVRLDAFTIDDESPKTGRIGVHRFDAHVFDRPHDSGGRGQIETKRIMGLVDAALSEWSPISGQPQLMLETTFVDLDDDGATVHGRATYSVTLGG